MIAATGSGSTAPSLITGQTAPRSRRVFPSARWRVLLVALLLPALFGSVFLTLTPHVAAADTTFTVNDTTDAVDLDTTNATCDSNIAPGDQCTLRAAIQQANALAAITSTTTFAIELAAGATYTLTLEGQNDDSAAKGDLDIRANVTINGHGAKVVGNGPLIEGRDRAFQVFSSWTVAINDLTITEGYAVNTNGGGILNDDFGTSAPPGLRATAAATGQLTLTNVILDDNGAGFSQQAEDNGGGVYNGAARTLIVNNSTFSNNTAANGGGLFNAGSAEISGSTFVTNTSQNIYILIVGASVGGGGIANTGTLALASSKLIGNSASMGGGLSTGTILVTPPPPPPPVRASAVSASVMITGTEISNNTATYLGRGIANVVIGLGGRPPPDISTSMVTHAGGSIKNNTASGFSGSLGGGGGGVANAATMELSNVAIADNSAAAVGTSSDSTGVGGGVFNLGAMTIEQVL